MAVAGWLENMTFCDPPQENRHTATIQDADHVTLLGITRGKTNIAMLIFEELAIEHDGLDAL
jgi:hypothetical protein